MENASKALIIAGARLISILLILISCIVFFAFSLICMSISFYLMDGENISQGIYGMFLSTSLYHGGAFTGILRFIFIFIIPSLLLGAIPVELVKSLSIIDISIVLLFTSVWLIISILFFYKSLKKILSKLDVELIEKDFECCSHYLHSKYNCIFGYQFIKREGPLL